MYFLCHCCLSYRRVLMSNKMAAKIESKMETFDSNGAKIALTLFKSWKRGQRKGYNAEKQCAPMAAVNCTSVLSHTTADVCGCLHRTIGELFGTGPWDYSLVLWTWLINEFYPISLKCLALRKLRKGHFWWVVVVYRKKIIKLLKMSLKEM